MLRKLRNLSQSIWYWMALIILGLMLESVALFYQYVLDYPPCVLCIHVRIWIMGFMLVAIAALVLRPYRYTSAISHLLTTAMMIGGLERSWYLLGIERGAVIGSCGMDAGLPTWLPLDQWLPWVFMVWEACGKSPLLPLKVSMAEALPVVFGILLVISGVLLVISIWDLLTKLRA